MSAPAPPRPWWRREPSALLLLVQLLGLLVYPWLEHTAGGRALFAALGIVILGLALRVIAHGPTRTWIGWALALPAVGLTLLVTLLGGLWPERTALLVLAQTCEAALYAYAAYGLIHYMLSDHRVSRDELYAVAATFTLLAWAFAHAYSVCQQLWPGSFTAAVDPQAPRTWTELLFLSFTTLSSTGLGDVVPVRAPARALAMLEMFAGVMYMALVVSRLVGLVNEADRRRR